MERSASAGPALDDDQAKRPAAPDASKDAAPETANDAAPGASKDAAPETANDAASEAANDAVDCTKPASDPRCAAGAPEADPVEFGVGVRLRSVWVPKPVLDLFLSHAPGGAHDYGIGVDLVRRRGSTELQLGFEYERVNLAQGVYINKRDNVATGDEADYVLSPGASGNQFGWFTIEFTFVNHVAINPWLAFRYGAGLGIGILTGELDHYNIVCTNATNSSPEPGCVPPRFGGTGMYSEGNETQVAYDLPPVFPVVNAIVGVQFKPSDNVTINLEGGLRTLPFVGLSSAMFF